MDRTFKFDVPEIRKDDLSVKVENGVLSVEGARKLELEDKRDNCHRIERAFGRPVAGSPLTPPGGTS